MAAETSIDSGKPVGLAAVRRWMRDRLTSVRIAEWIRAAWRHLVPVRVPLIFVIAAVILVCGVPQIDELFSLSVAAVDQLRSSSSSRSVWLHPEVLRIFFFAALLGLSIWHSARTLLAFNIVRSEESSFAWPHAKFKQLAPRFLALSVLALIAWGFWRANGKSSQACAIAAVVAGILVWLAASLVRMVQGTARADSSDGGSPDKHNSADWRTHVPKTIWCLAWVAFVLLNLLATIYPALVAGAAESIGPLSTLLFLTSLFVIVTTPLVLLGACARVPVFALILIVACLIQILFAPHSHQMSMTTSHASAPPALTKAIRDWAGGTTCDTAYFVSAEGGGIRAAAWTALALARLERHLGDERFGQCIVAASGVSGGSLGLAAFVAGRKMLLESPELAKGNTSCEPQTPLSDQLECRLGHMMTRDFLSPLLAAMFTIDQAQLLWPRPFNHDRGTALELAFTRAFEQAFPTPPGWLNPFDPTFPLSSLYGGLGADAAPPAWTPLLLLNATDVHSGKRVLQAGVDLAGIDPTATTKHQPFKEAFRAAIDLSAKPGMNKDMSLVGAVHNSARFSYASPAGLRVASSAESALQVVDGGYFENSGATTLLDLLHAHSDVGAVGPRQQRLVVIHISNDVDETSKRPTRTSAEQASKKIYGEIMPPPKTLFETRSARGEYAREELFRYIEYSARSPAHRTLERKHLRIDLVKRPGGYPLPLGWRIGDCALAEMQEQLEQLDLPKQLGGLSGGPLPPVIRNLCRPAITTVIAN